jgi:hypothetical protein
MVLLVLSRIGDLLFGSESRSAWMISEVQREREAQQPLTMIVMMERTEIMEVEATQSQQLLYLNGFWLCVERAIIPSRSWRFSIACIPRF